MIVRVGAENGRTLPVGWVDGDRGDLDKNLIPANCGDGTVFCLGGLVRLDGDCAMCLWDFEVRHQGLARVWWGKKYTQWSAPWLVIVSCTVDK